MKHLGPSGEYFEVLDVNHSNRRFLTQSKESELSVLWFQSDDNHLNIDGVDYVFNTHDIICITDFIRIVPTKIKQLKVIRWNRPFYCVLLHDSEVSCRGILFYGASSVPLIHPKEKDLAKLQAVWVVLENEMQERDKFQLEMLQMLLKRILILCTRFYKEQANYKILGESVQIIRDYNFLADQHFREKQTVADYAKMLNKSPKTLSNLFKKLGLKTPLQYIQDRKIIEAHRLLIYTEKSVSEISYELGFTDVQAFSRFFKRQDGISPQSFRKKQTREKLPTT